MSDDAELRTAWTSAIGSSPESQTAFDDVVGRHREPTRRYHGVRHVTWVVRHVEALAPTVAVADLGAVIAAAFFHDAVYNSTAIDNEQQSAALAERVLGQLGWDASRCRAVGDLVRATDGHDATTDADTAVLLDADLAVLGSDPAAYQAYATGVRAEYGQLGDETWRVGRAGVLRRLLERPRLFSTEEGRSRWEARARANMTAELATLDR